MRWKLLVGSAIVEVAMLSVLVMNSASLIETRLTEQAELRQKEASLLLNAAIAPLLAARDHANIVSTIAATRSERGIVYIAVWDKHGRLVALDGWNATTPLPIPERPLDGNAKRSRFDIRLPLSVGDQRHGELQFGISTLFLIEAREHLVRQSIFIASIGLMFSVALLTLLGVWLTRRLKRLEESSLAVSRGDFSQRVDISGGDEVERLGLAFNRMAGEISQQMRALHDSEERFRHLSELASDWYWEQDAEYRFTRFTSGSFRNYPEFARAALGMRRWESEFIRLPTEEMAAHRATVEAHQPFRDFEYLASDASGKERWLSINGEPTFDDNGNFTGYHGSGRDITARKRAEAAMHESEQKFAGLFHLTPLPLSLTDLSTSLLIDVNEAWSNLFGVAHGDAISRSLAVLQLFEYDNERSAFEGLIARHGRCELIEAHLRNHAGKILNCELSGRTLEIGEHRYFLWCARDVTDQRTAEAKIRELNARLESRVAERTRELQAAVDTLKRTQDELVNSEKLAALGRIVAGVAHELNTPIGNSVMVATTLDERTRDFADQVASGSIRRSVINEYVGGSVTGVELLMRNLRQAHNLIHSFKQVAVDQTSERRRTFDLKATLEEIVATMSPQLRKTAYRLVLDIPETATIESYPGPLGQIVTNLVNNALLHAFDGIDEGEMRLSVRCPEAQPIEIRFSDNGRGMDADHRRRIFDPFFTTRMGRGGSGLGLHIVYNIVTGVLGGQIEVSSTPGQGTAFAIRIPRVAPVRGENDARPDLDDE